MTNDATSQAALRAEIRLLRDEGVYGSSMVPYLTVLRAIFDTTEDYVDQVDEEEAAVADTGELHVSAAVMPPPPPDDRPE